MQFNIPRVADKKLVVPYQIDPDYGENESNEASVLLGTAMTWMIA
jgi:hypothetical protein